MFGYATDETEECMPLTIVLAHKLNAKLAELRRDGTLPWLRPDSKTQVRRGGSLSACRCEGWECTGLNKELSTAWKRSVSRGQRCV